MPSLRFCVKWIDYFVEIFPWIINKTIEYITYIWGGIYDYLLYPLYRVFIYYPFYVFFWQTFLNGIWNQTYALYCFLWELSVKVLSSLNDTFWNMYNSLWELYDTFWEIYARIFTGRLTAILNEMYESFWNAYNDMLGALDTMWVRITGITN